MAADIIITIALATAVVLIFSQFGRVLRAMMMHRTVRDALTRESNLTPELLAKIEDEKAMAGFGDDRIGLVLLAIGFAIIGFGLLTGSPDDARNYIGMALFPLLVGGVLFGRFWVMRRIDRDA